jgi:hypothetical protein
MVSGGNAVWHMHQIAFPRLQHVGEHQLSPSAKKTRMNRAHYLDQDEPGGTRNNR